MHASRTSSLSFFNASDASQYIFLTVFILGFLSPLSLKGTRFEHLLKHVGGALTTLYILLLLFIMIIEKSEILLIIFRFAVFVSRIFDWRRCSLIMSGTSIHIFELGMMALIIIIISTNFRTSVKDYLLLELIVIFCYIESN